MARNRAGVVIIKDRNVALIKRVKNNETYYVLPGGGIEHGETYEQAATREAFEELGVTVQVGPLFATIVDGGEQYYFTANILSGEFGSGTGEEFENRSSGTYQAVWIPITAINQVNVYPTAIASHLIENDNSEKSRREP
ncbi:NUDIX hydrolase [Pseudalkalibacillus hwajinpoensis]|uniref:NUDIX domain-containing protein n=1 Tax=Guptibacillus hwajinpoensis TaxID=208199 RepID=A0A4U1MNC7_9BACL|nr:NUDIX domain-containing protein [Pseudalkalibacillus hwajinpoensis]TKD72497.1 NUDIX domain-containing protein [Pseudalkalibacillus hwajinpoensis]